MRRAVDSIAGRFRSRLAGQSLQPRAGQSLRPRRCPKRQAPATIALKWIRMVLLLLLLLMVLPLLLLLLFLFRVTRLAEPSYRSICASRTANETADATSLKNRPPLLLNGCGPFGRPTLCDLRR